MTKKELREIIDDEIMWRLKFAIDEAESENRFDWYIKEQCENIQGMLLVAESCKLLNHKEWEACMMVINRFSICYAHQGQKGISYKYW